MSELTKEELEAYLPLEEYLRDGGFIKKDCWLKPLHVRYNPRTHEYELMERISASDGTRFMGVVERFYSLQSIPYVGTWIKCDEWGNPIE